MQNKLFTNLFTKSFENVRNEFTEDSKNLKELLSYFHFVKRSKSTLHKTKSFLSLCLYAPMAKKVHFHYLVAHNSFPEFYPF